MALINFSGLASGIDSAALIDALIEQKRSAQVDPLEDKATAFEETNSSLEELKTLLESLSASAYKFRALNGGAIAKVATSSNESVMTATAGNSANSGSYQVTVSQLAKNATYTLAPSSGSWGSTDAVMDAAAADNIVTTVGTGSNQETISIAVNGSTTLSDYVNEFNSTSSLATASLVNVGTSATPDYRIMISSHNEGEEKGAITLNQGSVQVTDTASDAANAQINIAGIGTVTRQSNTINDVVPGVTFQLQATSASAVTINVANDPDETIAALQEFVEAFNEVVNYVKESDLISQKRDSSGHLQNIFGPLAKTGLDDNLVSALRGAIAGAGITGGDYSIMADLGVTTERDGTLKFNADTFSTAIAANPYDVQSILENLGETLAATSGTIEQFTRFNGLFDVTVSANQSAISTLQNQISDVESRLEKEKQSLTSRYARLESLIGGLQQQQSALTNILPK